LFGTRSDEASAGHTTRHRVPSPIGGRGVSGRGQEERVDDPPKDVIPF
jgi:hypothetical protein